MNEPAREIPAQNQPERNNDNWRDIYQFALKLAESEKRTTREERLEGKAFVREFKFRSTDIIIRTRLEEKPSSTFMLTFYPASLVGNVPFRQKLKIDAGFLTGKHQEYDKISVFMSKYNVNVTGYDGNYQHKLELSDTDDSTKKLEAFLYQTAKSGIRPK